MGNDYLKNERLTELVLGVQCARRKLVRAKNRVARLQAPKPGRPRKDAADVLDAARRAEADALATLRQLEADVGQCFYVLAENVVRYARFIGVDTEDAIQEGVLVCLTKLHRYDHSRGAKCFNFFTTVILNHLRMMWRTSKNYYDRLQRMQRAFETGEVDWLRDR